MDNENKTDKNQTSEISPTDKPQDNTAGPLEDEWLAISQDWQSQPYEKSSIEALVNKTKRRTLQAKLLLLFDIIGSLAIFILLFYNLYQGDLDTPTLLYLAFGALGSASFVYAAIKIRFASWRSFMVSPENVINIAIIGAKSSLQYLKLIKYSFYIFLPIVNWYVYEMSLVKEKSLLIPLIFLNGFMVICFCITHFYQNKRERELQQLIDFTLE